VTLPAGVIERVDRDQRKVHVRRTKEQIKNAPELGATFDDELRHGLGGYYGPGGPGHTDW
jgi:hypothetical protein